MIINSPINLHGIKIANRVVLQPMEGCDCNEDGSPSELTIAKYQNNASNGAGIIWFEANAVVPEGRTNTRQMMMTKQNIGLFKQMVTDVKKTQYDKFGYEPVCFIQLTHSGRQSIKPMIAYRNAVYEKDRPVTDQNIVSDEYLDSLPAHYANSALLAKEAGFDGIDLKCCHGYLMQEVLSAYNRLGKYGGNFKNRSRLYLDCLSEIKKVIGDSLIISTRFSVSDYVPYPYGFGTTKDGKLSLDEPVQFIKNAQNNGIELFNITLGNPYFNPHVNRPFRKGGYTPPEEPETSLSKFFEVGNTLKDKIPKLLFVNSALSYYREDMMKKAESMLKTGAADFVGFGRVTLAYPNFYAEFLDGNFTGKKCCVTCSRCTELMRAKQVSGCAIFNPYYRDLYKNTVGN